MRVLAVRRPHKSGDVKEKNTEFRLVQTHTNTHTHKYVL
jgi:hypothetical protein